MVSMNLLLSAFVAVSEDFHQLYLAIVRVIIYSLPIMWSYDKVDSTLIHILLRINPMVYVIRGFRNVFVQGMTQNIGYSNRDLCLGMLCPVQAAEALCGFHIKGDGAYG